MLFAFIFSEKICVAQFVGDVKQENKTEQENKAKQENKTDQDNQPKTYTGLELCSLHDLDKGSVYDFGDEITLYKIGKLSDKKPAVLATQMKDGFIIRGVYENSPADTVKLETDDIIVSFNGRRFDSLEKYETWLKNNITPKISLIVYKRSGNYQKNKTIIITPTAEKPDNVKTKKTSSNATEFKTYDQEKQEKKQALETRLKNAKTEPLFEGSNLKKIMDAEKVFGTESIHVWDIPKSYISDDTFLSVKNYDGTENTIVLDGIKLIKVTPETMNYINEVISVIKNQEDREIVLKWLVNCDITKDKIEKDLMCFYKCPSLHDDSVSIDITIKTNQKIILGWLHFNTQAKEWLFADTVRVVVVNGFYLTYGKIKIKSKFL
jgi:hypothetical protein